LKKLIFITGCIILVCANFASGQNKQPKEHRSENEKCFQCHGGSKYFYFNPDLGREIKEKMNPDRVIQRDAFYNSNHKGFRCTDCHSPDYDSFPHPVTLRFEPKYVCLDCHGGDEQYAKFNFEKIDTEFAESVHSSRHSEDFSCWMCHNPHTYKISARKETVVKKIIANDNAICLNCHANTDNYQMLTDKVNPDIISKHEWLPNQKLHFGSVRCLECHGKFQKDILVAHNIRPKEEAVKNCVECHSQNSLLLESLYRYEVKEKVSRFGFFNARILNEYYLIGANRNYFLNITSFVLFILVIFFIIIHLGLRIYKKSI